MSDFFTELEEDIREERIALLWKKYGNYVIGLALLIVIGTVGYTLRKYYKEKWQISDSVAFSKAVRLMNTGKKEEALKAFQELSKERGGYSTLSQLYEASLISNPSELYSKISKKHKNDPAFSTLPKVLLAARFLNNSEVMASLEPLTIATNPWAPLSLELLALSALRKGDTTLAAQRYAQMLYERSSTPSEQRRASLMLSQLDVPLSLLEGKFQKEKNQ